LSAIKATLADETQIGPHSLEIQPGNELEKSLGIQPILQAGVRHAEHLHGKKLFRRCHGDESRRCNLDWLCALDDLTFDARACEEKGDSYA
jgi:hypothetical protein